MRILSLVTPAALNLQKQLYAATTEFMTERSRRQVLYAQLIIEIITRVLSALLMMLRTILLPWPCDLHRQLQRFTGRKKKRKKKGGGVV
jgi:hypothetical protein